jgi:hypothetical protein
VRVRVRGPLALVVSGVSTRVVLCLCATYDASLGSPSAQSHVLTLVLQHRFASVPIG